LDVDTDGLVIALEKLTEGDIRRVAELLRGHGDSAAGELDAWHATIDIDRALRRQRLSREAAHSATRATHAVQAAAAASGVELPDPDVTVVARAAAEIARALLVGPDTSIDVRHLVDDWEHLVA